MRTTVVYAVALSLALVGASHVWAATTVLGLPLSFEPNRGQSDPAVQFVSHGISGTRYTLFLTRDGAVLGLSAPDKDHAGAVVSMKLAGARPVQGSGVSALAGKVNYFLGNDPTKWIRGIPTYSRVQYAQIYQGIDLVYYGSEGQLEYDLVVAPGADTGQIALEFPGAQPRLGSDGTLQIAVEGIPLKLRKPLVYQTIDGKKELIAGGYKVNGSRVQFALGAYDRRRQLVIDPVFDYLTYLGGSGGLTMIGPAQTSCPQCSPNPAQGVAVDKSGNLYVTGYTTSTSFPLQNPYQSQFKGSDINGTVFVTKINPDASALFYSTYLGGTVYDRASAIAVDSSGSAYITGQAFSPDFPVTQGAYQTICAPEPGANNTLTSGCSTLSNAFLTKLSADGSSLIYSTFLGGSHNAEANAVAIDSKGQAYIAGFSNDQCDSSHLYRCFPETANAVLPQALYNTSLNPLSGNPGAAFVAVFDAAGANLLYGTLYGDKDPSNNAHNTFTTGTGVAVDASGNFYLTGFGPDPELPTTPGAFQPTGTNNDPAGNYLYRGFVAKFSPVAGAGTGASLIYGTYLGGTSLALGEGEQVAGMAVDASGNAYITGYTQSFDFPVTAGANATTDCGPATYECQAIGFLTKLNPSGSALVWSTLVGPSVNVIGGTLNTIGVPRLDAAGDVYITGQAAYGYPVGNPVQPAAQDLNGGVFVTEYDPTGSTILFSTVIYGPSGGAVYPGGMDIDAQGNIYVGGETSTFDLPVTSGVFEPVCTGCVQRAGFLAKINPNPTAGAPVVKSAAAGQVLPFAAEAIVAAYGVGLASTTDTASTIPLPTSLDGNSVTVTDSAGVARPAPLFYISTTQINFEIPAGVSAGNATVMFQNADGSTQSAAIQTGNVSPGIFELDSAGLVAAWVLPVISGTQEPLQPVYQVVGGSVAPLPIDVSAPNEQYYLEMYGTGLRNAVNVTATVGNLSVPVLYAGAAPGYAGLDQVNIGPLPLSLAGAGVVNIVVQADGQAANIVTVGIQ